MSTTNPMDGWIVVSGTTSHAGIKNEVRVNRFSTHVWESYNRF